MMSAIISYAKKNAPKSIKKLYIKYFFRKKYGFEKDVVWHKRDFSTASFIFATIMNEKKMLVIDKKVSKYYKEISENIDVAETLDGVDVKKYEIVVVMEEGAILRDDALTKIAQLLLSDDFSKSIITSAITLKSNNKTRTLVKPDKQLISLPLLKMHSGFFAFRSNLLPSEFKFNSNKSLLNSFHYLFVALSRVNQNIYFKSIPIPLCEVNIELRNKAHHFSILTYNEYESIIYKELMHAFNLFFLKKNGLIILKPFPINGDRKKSVAVIIPFKNHLKMTVDAIKSIKKTMPSAKIVAVDNSSNNSRELDELKTMVDEYILADFPYNYSKIHNYAVEKSKLIKFCEYIIFMNNDVVISDCDIDRLYNWFIFSNVSAVGCKLLYPTGEVQFGGVGRSRYNQVGNHGWYHIDQHLKEYNAYVSNLTYSAHSLTCAFVIVKFKSYIDANGFDSILTPIGFSDARLFMKIRSDHNILIYDGVHHAIHHESISRGISYNDDLEAYASDLTISDAHSNLTMEIH